MREDGAPRALLRTQEGQFWHLHFIVEGFHCQLHYSDECITDFREESGSILASNNLWQLHHYISPGGKTEDREMSVSPQVSLEV